MLALHRSQVYHDAHENHCEHRQEAMMYDTVAIQLPGDVRQMLNRTPEELARDIRLYAGLMLFRLGKLSSGAAAEMAGVPRVMFLDLCAEYDIPVSQMTAEDLRHELADG
jgi:predicted HTH domain antitoxin